MVIKRFIRANASPTHERFPVRHIQRLAGLKFQIIQLKIFRSTNETIEDFFNVFWGLRKNSAANARFGIGSKKVFFSFYCSVFPILLNR